MSLLFASLLLLGHEDVNIADCVIIFLSTVSATRFQLSNFKLNDIKPNNCYPRHLCQKIRPSDPNELGRLTSSPATLVDQVTNYLSVSEVLGSFGFLWTKFRRFQMFWRSVVHVGQLNKRVELTCIK